MSRIQNNTMASNTHRMYTKNNAAVGKSAEKLSSGFRINRAGDDAAGLAISEKMRAQIRGLNMASKNSSDAISLVQTAEGALQEVQTMLQRMNEIAVQAASDTNVTIDRNALQLEFSNLQEEIDQIAQTTKFNESLLFDGKMGGNGMVGVTVGAAGGAGTNIQGIKVTGPEGKTVQYTEVATTGSTSVKAAFDANGNLTLTVDAAAGAVITEEMFNDAIANATGNRPANASDYKVMIDGGSVTAAADSATGASAATGVAMTKAAFASSTNSKGVSFKMNKAGVNTSTILVSNSGTLAAGASVDANGNVTLNLHGTVNYTADEINEMLKAAGADMTVDFVGTKAGSDVMDGFNAAVVVGDTPTGGSGVQGAGLDGGKGIVIQVGAEEGHTLDIKIDAMNTTGLKITKALANISTRDSASKAITTSREALNKISSQRATLGAMQNRLEYKITSLDITAENLQVAEGRIRDVDMAKEMTNFTKNNILTQAATAMLAQANAAPQNVLQLLG